MNKSYEWQGMKKERDYPHGWIQWKGTDVCMDVYCRCGYHGHIDEEFAYFYKCPKCGVVYEIDGHVELLEIKNPEDYDLSCIVTSDP